MESHSRTCGLSSLLEGWYIYQDLACVDLRLSAERFKSTLEVAPVSAKIWERLLQKHHKLSYSSLIMSIHSVFLFDGYKTWDLFVPTSMCSSKPTPPGCVSLTDQYKHSFVLLIHCFFKAFILNWYFPLKENSMVPCPSILLFVSRRKFFTEENDFLNLL